MKLRSLSFVSANSWFILLILAASVPAAVAQDIFVTPVPNAPFSAVVNIERSRVQPDGSVLNLKTIRDIARDSRGRIHNESRALLPASSTDAPPLIRIHVYDPQTRISTYLIPGKQTYWTQTTNHPPSTEPPTIRFTGPTGSAPQNEFAKEEDLGIREIEGVSAHGVRETQVVPAEASGTGKEVAVTDEYWYSEDLRINLFIRHSDPRTQTVTMKVSQITRTEPDPALFQIPEGYKPAGANREADE
jgi:hypothetical protein